MPVSPRLLGRHWQHRGAPAAGANLSLCTQTLGHLEKAVVLELTLKHVKALTNLIEQQQQKIMALQSGLQAGECSEQGESLCVCVCVMDFPWEPVKCGSDTLFPQKGGDRNCGFHAVIFSGFAYELSPKKKTMRCSRWSVQSALEFV